jgi:hypothetical protein
MAVGFGGVEAATSGAVGWEAAGASQLPLEIFAKNGIYFPLCATL